MRLTQPLPIRNTIAPSRVMFGPHETNLGFQRAFGERHVPYYARRAAGGAGIIVLEEASVHASDHPYERSPLASACGMGWTAVVAGIRATGTSPVVLAALGHAGGQGSSHWNQAPLWAPSPVPEVASREVPKVLETYEIDAVIQGFGDAAKVAVDSGLHGVEINAGQFSLVRQFLSGLTNMRSDAYGVDRLLFAREALNAARTGAGPNAIVALRLCIDELAPWAGIVPDAGAQIAAELSGLVDLITVVRGSIFTTWATRPDGHTEAGFGVNLARQVKAALPHVLVVAQGSIVDASQAELAISSGACDAVEMTRAQLADADLVAKLRAGDPERVRPCILCNQTCKVRDNRNPIVSCVSDPRTGHEWEEPADATVGRTDAGRVTIVGGGVAGLECARAAAERGWSVRVLERSAAVGGVAMVAAQGAGRERLGLIVQWLRDECMRLGVVVETGVEVDADALAHLGANGPVVLCTGGIAAAPPFRVADGAVVVSAAAYLGGTQLPAGTIAVWDPLGGPIAVSVAERLAHAGRDVVFITPDLLVGEKLALCGDLAPVQNRLHAARVRLVRQALVRSVEVESVHVEDRFGGERAVIAAAAVVACGHAIPDHRVDPLELYPQAGDRVAPRTMYEAILEGRRIAASLR